MTNIKHSLIAKRYADALFTLTKEYNADVHIINNQLKEISDSLNQSEELSQLMNNPTLSNDEKKDVIISLLEGKVDVIILRFIKLLIEKNRFAAFNEISNAFEIKVNENDNIQKVYVTSAIEMREELKNKLKDKLAQKLNKNIDLIMEVNSNIIAGLVIKINDNVIDMSLNNRFEEMKKEMIK
jgi:F-type H+-transporting ATPase subunit delta